MSIASKMLKHCLIVVLLGLPQAAFAAEPIAKIVGGTLAPNHAYPFMVAIEINGSNFRFCGGTLIAPNKVLTAGHCLEKGSPIHVRIGTNNSAIDPGQVINVISQARHPKYNDFTLDYDVAIFTLATPIILSDIKNIMNLPEACSSSVCITGLARPGSIVRTTGWGATRGNGTAFSANLRQVDLPIVANPTCNAALKGGVTARMQCAGFAVGGKDSCTGDSGGPLFGYLPSSRSGIQTGIVSWGVGDCGQAGLYGVYTRISHPEIRAFIRQQTGR